MKHLAVWALAALATPALAQTPWPDARQFHSRCLQQVQHYPLPATAAQLSDICRCTHEQIVLDYRGTAAPARAEQDAEFQRRVLDAARRCALRIILPQQTAQ
ncbi:hypothetical protein L1281_001862 [Neisseria sp. HSC-16F19]|nr:hypothetical protein [Neisseria sp. HSC-16F19]MCP2041264.1 hypothetical protein [Neisseria sp. HSC-16F19]